MPQDLKPPEHPTARLPQPSEELILLKQLTLSLKQLDERVGLLVDEGVATNARLARAEVRIEEIVSRQNTNSHRAQAMSQMDLEQDKRVADEIIAREALAKEVSAIREEQTVLADESKENLRINRKLLRIASNPILKKAIELVVMGIGLYLAARFGIQLPR